MSAARGRSCAERYQARISGPLLDRIDLQIEVPAVSAADLVLPQASEGSAEVRTRVAAARRVQAERYAAFGCQRIRTNAECEGALLDEIAAPDASGLTLLRDAADALALSARGYHRTLRVARLFCRPRWRNARGPHPCRGDAQLSRRDLAPRASRRLIARANTSFPSFGVAWKRIPPCARRKAWHRSDRRRVHVSVTTRLKRSRPACCHKT